MTENNPLEILRKVQSGELSPAEAAQYLEPADEPAAPALSPHSPLPLEEEGLNFELGWWKYAWMVPLSIGIAVLAPAAVLLNWAYLNERYFWFFCSWLPLMLGMLLLLIGVWSAQARWVHLRIQEAKGNRVNISIPLPLWMTSWFLRIFSRWIPGLKEKHLEQVPALLDALRHTHDPISVEVDDKDGDRVRIYIL